MRTTALGWCHTLRQVPGTAACCVGAGPAVCGRMRYILEGMDLPPARRSPAGAAAALVAIAAAARLTSGTTKSLRTVAVVEKATGRKRERGTAEVDSVRDGRMHSLGPVFSIRPRRNGFYYQISVG